MLKSSRPNPRQISTVLLTALLTACATQHDRIVPLPLPTSQNDHIDVQGASLTATPYIDPKEAEAAFGFDVRGAGLLPVRIAIDNQGSSVVRIDPQQTFLIDKEGQAWPVLTSEQAYNRAHRAMELQEIAAGSGKSAALLGVAGGLTGFALSVILSRGVGTPLAQGILAGASLGAVTGGVEAEYALESKIRRDLATKTLRNQRIQPGQLAYGMLFFPGQNEVQSAEGLRIGLDFDSYPQVLNLPLKPPPLLRPQP